MVVHYLLHVSHDLGIASLGSGGSGIYRFAIGFKDGGGLGVEYEWNSKQSLG